jgi:ADP-ribosylglycohydrolase
MRHSLVSRFRGTLIGTLLSQNQANEEKNTCDAVVASCESLIALGRFDFEDWSVRQQSELIKQSFDQVLETAILATLPLALFFHENPVKLRHYLLDITRIWGDDLIVRDSTLAVSFAVTRSLTEQLTPTALIPQLVSFIGETTTELPQKLLKVNDLLEQRASLQQVKSEFNNYETKTNLVAIGFYCFLATLEDFRLSILLAHQNGIYSPLVSGIAGALSGAYNSAVGIPISWQLLYSRLKSPTTGLNSFREMVRLADGLFATWSGLYNPEPRASEGENTLFNKKLPLRETVYPLYVHTSPRTIKFR